jgi:hypothetical protein
LPQEGPNVYPGAEGIGIVKKSGGGENADGLLNKTVAFFYDT